MVPIMNFSRVVGQQQSATSNDLEDALSRISAPYGHTVAFLGSVDASNNAFEDQL